MNIQVLVSTMNQQNEKSLVEYMNLGDNYIIINQVTKPGMRLKNNSTANHKFLSFSEKGLSKSRNRAIYNSAADVCVIADDDMYYETNYEKTIKEAYVKHPDADIIAFRVANEDPAALSKEIPEGRVNLITSMKLSSVRITFRKQSLIQKGISFNENFGAGSKFYMGEENLFLSDCLKKGLKIYYVSEKIATLRLNESSSWFQGYDRNYFNVKGLVYYHMSKLWFPLYIMLFAIRKRRIYGNSIPMLSALKYMFEGIVRNRIKKVYFAGDFLSDTGPGQVNKNYYKYLNNEIYVCKSNNKIIRIAHFVSKLLFVDEIIVSGLSKFHLDIVKIAKLFGKKTFYLMHGYNVIEYKFSNVVDPNRLLLEKDLLDEVDVIICVSEKFADIMNAYRPKLSGKISFVNNGVDTLINNSQQNRNGKYTILSVGGGMKRKNNLDVCRAINSLNNTSIKFIVIGDEGDDGEEIRKFPFVTYYDKLSHSEVIEMMKSSDLYVQNSKFETFGLAVCEAVAQSCDVLLSENVGAISVIDNIDSLRIISKDDSYSDIASRIEKLVKQRDNRPALVFAVGSGWDDASRRLLKIIRGYGDVA